MKPIKKIKLSFSVPFLVVSAGLLFLSGCAGKPLSQAQVGPQPLPVYQSPAGPQTAPEPPPPPTQEALRKEAPEMRKRIHVVLGGAGVASFATIGLLKRFQEEGFQLDSIVATGWPALFGLGYGFLKSVHDLEWFAMRLKDSDFTGLLSGEGEVPSLITGTFGQTDLAVSKVPIVVSALTPGQSQGEVFDRGDWKPILQGAMKVPGLPKTEGAIPPLVRPLDVQEAFRRGGKIVVAINMYDDYLDFLKPNKREAPDKAFRKALSKEFKKALGDSLKEATVVGRISLNKGPLDFNAKRTAIVAGYREGTRLAKLIRTITPPP